MLKSRDLKHVAYIYVYSIYNGVRLSLSGAISGFCFEFLVCDFFLHNKD